MGASPTKPVMLTPTLPIGSGQPMVFIAGPCIIESAEHCLKMARFLRDIADETGIPLVFKASFDKANRSSIDAFRGPGMAEGLAILAAVKREVGLPVLTDVHEVAQAEAAAQVVDVLQVPAFLCRQTDLVIACGRTGRAVNIKKGQFMAPLDMKNVIEKVHRTGNLNVTLTERGTSFGYNNLVVDLRGISIMRTFAPVVFDATHSLQLPGAGGHETGGVKQFHLPLARGVVAAGVDAIFAEVHDNPTQALSDRTTQLSVAEFRILVQQTMALRKTMDTLVSENSAANE